MSSEDIAAIVMVPAVMREAFRDPAGIEDMEACLKTCTAYSAEVDRFAFSKEERTRDFYERFRGLLSKYTLVFQDDYALIEFLTDAQIDYALEKIREAKGEKSFERIDASAETNA